MLLKDYYIIDEALERVNKLVLGFNLKDSDLYYYGETNKLNFHLYVGSRPAFAAVYDVDTDNVFFVGCCLIQGLAALKIENLRALIAKEQHVIDMLPNENSLYMADWSTDLPHDCAKAKPPYITT
ncbi:MAG: hypothetical protein ACNA7Y_01055, partial [Gammaproteobacteria bacterium]